ncbi:hypothetical protein EW146_g1028 [Bondarzewia mesenterica]|uniref:tRNA ligase n=1 Tax=Bondarzewia mesenterica TaxID=1095465 RepID=A0A4S4M710_9AGAM|nr:hypothetical protein EW146_g1028 [Bondarzewia mesenterica]
MAPAFSEGDSKLIADLHALSKRSPKLVRSSEYAAPAAPETIIESWKMNEFKYYDIPSPFPTLARGLFTTKLQGETGKDMRYRIVVRGYDKFFNIGEVPWTTWESLEHHTAPPYTLTLKSNGCIIFIAALTPSKLLITSKHSLGPVGGAEESHAQVGERWLLHHLEIAGKTTEQLAQRLWDSNWTAVAELCDDSFEEHVLPYSQDKTGLHLHGLNESTKLFKTMSTSVVDAFAEEWGFIQTPSTVLSTVPEVKAFTEEISKAQKWRGEALEGFVVRTTVSDPPTKGHSTPAASPYATGSSFFFKVKFDEPYMMYRDWREVTKVLLSTKGPLSEAKIPRSKMKRAETKVYVEWVRGEIKRDRAQFSGYTKGKGIIATRERFLKWLESGEGKKEKKQAVVETEKEAGVFVNEGGKKFGKTIIVPVAIPGVGKTSVAVALAYLFNFGHTQSDDVRAKKAGPVFVQNVLKLLKDHDIVIADKNNHLRMHRTALREATKSMRPRVRLLALNWSLDQPLSTIHRICGDRILERGENHQTLIGDAEAKAHEDVIWQFLNNAEELGENEVDDIIDMDLSEPLEDAVERAVNGIVDVLKLEKPSRESIGMALGAARAYSPATRGSIKDDKSKRKEMGGQGKAEGKEKTKAARPPRYYGLLAEVDLKDLLAGKLVGGEGVPKEATQFWEVLNKSDRVAPRPHVTIVHEKSLPDEIDLWQRCESLHQLAKPPLFKFKLGHVLTDGRVMAVTVEDLAVDDAEGDEGQAGQEFVSTLGEDARQRTHITVGTKEKSIMPIEGKLLVERWRSGKAEGIVDVPLEGVFAKGRVKGLMS